MKKQNVQFIILYSFAFLLLWEWLRPLESITETRHTFLFVIFLGLQFLFVYLKPKWYISLSVNVGFMFVVLQMLFYEGAFLGLEWIALFIQDVFSNLMYIVQFDFYSLTNSFRTLLFFILLWLLVYLVHYWLIQKQRIMFFVFLTFIYVTVLDTFTPFSGKTSIVRMVVIGFAMLSFVFFQRLQQKEMLERHFYLKWMIPLVVLIGTSTTVGMLAPKAEPIWPDPVAFIQTYGENGNGGVKKIGYSPDDSQLGGPFVKDDTEVFTVIDSEEHYWKIESKYVYTGKGWTGDEERSIPELTFTEEEFRLPNINNVFVSTTSHQAEMKVNESYPYNHIPYPIYLTSIESDADYYEMGVLKEYYEYVRVDDQKVTEFQLSYEYPKFNRKYLEAVTGEYEGTEVDYLQLPLSLPERVVDLAEELTKNEDNWYDKVRAIEQYLSSSEFEYNIEDVAIPSEDQDYVDQFLFDTKKGYCDNFSSSMVVLLRSIGIPARWTKGYTSGEIVEVLGDGTNKYQVTNNNAHSWVEVYFPDVGWVPFEPTKTFSDPIQFAYDIEETESTVQTDDSETENTPEKPDPLEKDLMEETSSSSSTGSKENSFEKMSNWLIQEKNGIWVSIVIILIGCFVYWTRYKWYQVIVLYKYRFSGSDSAFFKAYASLLKHYSHLGLPKKEGQTLRDYAKYIDEFYETHDMRKLTNSYEKVLYRNESAKEQWEKSKELWENLIKKKLS
ncbi:transglutaminase domain-containing protein [Bacillus carboniphilus]|uniref:Transglutaminase domain-containing protein n=1 Tax=Bacillus carboniphilus TaxID=86663 RepID=A0ABY9JS48_9BACI|nr:transglutaminase domain-containing protein [Bacillus carboniphilus]WLR42234.1 transglutaminase domain-containing protein [Bacillus carboniphilus]